MSKQGIRKRGYKSSNLQEKPSCQKSERARFKFNGISLAMNLENHLFFHFAPLNFLSFLTNIPTRKESQTDC